jgi:chemotaxis response regulator CheB
VSAPVRVLVCDDQALIRAGFTTIIDAQPDLDAVGERGDGRAAVDLARRLRPDVVVMDVRMALLDGSRRPACWPVPGWCIRSRCSW